MASVLDTNDPRWQLTSRILTSPLFEKSPRLSAFLRFICELELTGRRAEISEHQIGVQVFGRSPAYNPGEDSIVRSQARFLRQRLDDYFRTIGKQEPVRITIPKGNYVPLFEENRESANQAVNASSAEANETSEPADTELPQKTLSRRSMLIAAVLTATALALCGLLFFRYRAAFPGSPASRFWNAVFDPRRAQVIVPADSGLILAEDALGKQVSLQSYLTRQYLAEMPPNDCPGQLAKAGFETVRYTSMADLILVAKITHVPEVRQMRAEIRSARDLSISDAKERNLVIIGGPRANPWVELFINNMNFYVDYDWKDHQNMVVNKSPLKDEAPRYIENTTGSTRHVYGVIAFEPSLDHEGNALLVAGTDSAGTQSAADFLMSGHPFDEFLRQIQRRDGSIPHFELLLEGFSLSGNVPQSKIVASRVMP